MMSNRGAARPGAGAVATRRGALLTAAALYIVWTAATYLLEGLPRTFARPEDAASRLVYALVANVLIGTALSLWVTRGLERGGLASTAQLGFRRAGRTVVSVVAALSLGFAGYALQGPPTFDPIVLLNAFAQVLVVSIAEVLVCWIVVGGTTWAALRAHGAATRPVALVLVSSILFGLYHFAHSPPFDTPEVVFFLSGVGSLTGIFFLISREVYGTIAFHNFLGMLGVLRALEQAGRLETFAAPQWPLVATAGLAVGTLVCLHGLWLGRTPTPRSQNRAEPWGAEPDGGADRRANPGSEKDRSGGGA